MQILGVFFIFIFIVTYVGYSYTNIGSYFEVSFVNSCVILYIFCNARLIIF
jgi:hypothetical protein